MTPIEQGEQGGQDDLVAAVTLSQRVLGFTYHSYAEVHPEMLPAAAEALQLASAVSYYAVTRPLQEGERVAARADSFAALFSATETLRHEVDVAAAGPVVAAATQDLCKALDGVYTLLGGDPARQSDAPEEQQQQAPQEEASSEDWWPHPGEGGRGQGGRDGDPDDSALSGDPTTPPFP